jgi:NAD(P)-dependent dehydrogenase (short-subunit alcohol dehydrogenase family)
MVETAGGGAIVNISSRSSDMVQQSFVAYAAGKAALNMMTRNLAAEVAPKVRVNAISVGGIATDALQVVLTNDELRAQFEANTPMGRAGHRRGHRRVCALPGVAGVGLGDGQDLPGRRRDRVPGDHRAGAEALVR